LGPLALSTVKKFKRIQRIQRIEPAKEMALPP
jgi:hypothetical protein